VYCFKILLSVGPARKTAVFAENRQHDHAMVQAYSGKKKRRTINTSSLLIGCEHGTTMDSIFNPIGHGSLYLLHLTTTGYTSHEL
jgi:uncharacterized protein with von Willebrand factor type A (vWA) domain